MQANPFSLFYKSLILRQIQINELILSSYIVAIYHSHHITLFISSVYLYLFVLNSF